MMLKNGLKKHLIFIAFFKILEIEPLTKVWSILVTEKQLNPIRTRKNFLINGPRGDRIDRTHSNVYNSRITKDKISVFAPREAQFFDKKSKLFDIIFATLIFN